MRLLPLLVALVVLSCSPRDHTDDATLSAPQGCATTPQTDCDAAYNQAKKAPSVVTQKQLACAWLGIYLGACHPQPAPVPPSPGVGGSTASGGTTSIGGSSAVQGGASSIGGSSAVTTTTAPEIAFLDCNPASASAGKNPHHLLSGWHRRPDRAKHRRLTVSYSIVAPSSFPKANVAINLDQADLGSCTGNGTAQCLSTWPFTAKLTESNAVAIYSLATKLDSFAGTYPPTDTGSDGASAAKAAKQLGFTSLDFVAVDTVEGAQVALQKSTCIIGTDWTVNDSNPTACGEMKDGSAVQGGHEPQLAFWDAKLKRFGIRNSWLDWGNKRTGTSDTGYAYWSAGTLQKKLNAGAEIDCPVLP